LSINDRDNYAVLMRVAMLSSLEAADATANLGFRCAR
jgi:sulfatase modifying factor 1